MPDLREAEVANRSKPSARSLNRRKEIPFLLFRKNVVSIQVRVWSLGGFISVVPNNSNVAHAEHFQRNTPMV
jgi:hypothetical protein